MKIRNQLFFLIALISLISVATVGIRRVQAATTITVLNTSDSGAGSLRQAISASSSGDTIDFDSSLNGQTITLTSGELLVDKSITISGPGVDQLTVQRSTAAPEFRIFHIGSGTTV